MNENGLWFSELQVDALKEVVNVSMGRAGNSLARILDNFVCLSVPEIQVMKISEVAQRMQRVLGDKVSVSAVQQGFMGEVWGEAVLLITDPCLGDLSKMLGYDGPLSRQAEQEVTIELANVVLGACLCGLGKELQIEMTFTAPILLAEKVQAQPTLFPRDRLCDLALLVEICLSLEMRPSRCHLLLLTSEEAVRALRDSLDRYIGAILMQSGCG